MKSPLIFLFSLSFFALSCVSGMCGAFPNNENIADQIYDTTIKAEPDGTPDHILGFFWSALGGPGTTEIYNKIIMPIIVNRNTNKTLVVVSQIYLNDKRDIDGPGSLLLCSRNIRTYSAFAQFYSMSNFDSEISTAWVGPDKGGHKYFLNTAIENIAQRIGVSMNDCMKDAHFASRKLLQLKKSQYFYQQHNNQALPLIVLDGEALSPDDARLKQLAPSLSQH